MQIEPLFSLSYWIVLLLWIHMHPVVGVPEIPVSKTASNVKPTDAPSQKTTRPIPKSPSSNISSTDAGSNVTNASSESNAPATPGKGMARL